MTIYDTLWMLHVLHSSRFYIIKWLRIDIMPLAIGMVKEKLSFNAWTCGSSCVLSGWICLQTFYHNERSRMVSLRCEISCDPVGARDGKKLCDKCCTCDCWRGSACACSERECSHTFCDKYCRISHSLDSS